MKQAVIEISKRFWSAMEHRDGKTMREIADPRCRFVHIGGNCDLDKEVEAYTSGVFSPTEIILHKQEAEQFGDTAVVVTDCDYGLLLDGKPTTHHFAVTEVYQWHEDAWKLIQFSFTALVY